MLLQHAVCCSYDDTLMLFVELQALYMIDGSSIRGVCQCFHQPETVQVEEQ